VKILITGGAGFIGSHLADKFIADGHSVEVIDDFSTGRAENLPLEARIIARDVRGSISTESDLIVHCAASYKDPNNWFRDADVNVLGTINATQVAKRSGCPIVYMQTALPPISSYAISKTAGMQYIQQSGVPHLIFRLANIYGPRNLSGPIPTFYKMLSNGISCTVVDTSREMVYITDLVELVTEAIYRGAQGVYDVTGSSAKISTLYDYVAACLAGPHKTPMIIPPASDEAQTELDQLNTYPGWAPFTQLREGIGIAAKWYHDNPPAETFTHLRLEKA
jgi:UDP-glucose 4-epimerase